MFYNNKQLLQQFDEINNDRNDLLIEVRNLEDAIYNAE